jgi:lysine decarboxylase
VDALRQHAARETVRLHVPGHKGGAGADPALLDALGPDVLALDLPKHIRGVDVGASPTPLALAQTLAAHAWGARRTWFLTNGASQGNHAACLALAQTGGDVVVQGNVHCSTIDGLVLSGLHPRFVNPELDPELGIAHTITPEALEQALDMHPGAVAAMVVSPTYYGVCADVASLAAVAHERGVPLIVDEAWGAHLAFHPCLPEDALSAGADVVISSTHKVVGSLTQSAMIHIGPGAPSWLEESLQRALLIVESTSPSSLLLASLDAARRQAAVAGPELLRRAIDEMDDLREEIRSIPGLEVLDERLCGRPGVHAYDQLSLAIDVTGAGVTGYELDRALYELHGIDLELVNCQILVGLFGMGEPVAERGAALVAGLRLVCGSPNGSGRRFLVSNGNGNGHGNGNGQGDGVDSNGNGNGHVPLPSNGHANGHVHIPNGNGNGHHVTNGRGQAHSVGPAPAAEPPADGADLSAQQSSVATLVRPCRGPLEMSPREAFLGPRETIPATEAAGRIAAEALMAYPPGIPAVLPGERLTEEIIVYCREVLDRGGRLRGASDPHLRTVMVVVEPHERRG